MSISGVWSTGILELDWWVYLGWITGVLILSLKSGEGMGEELLLKFKNNTLKGDERQYHHRKHNRSP